MLSEVPALGLRMHKVPRWEAANKRCPLILSRLLRRLQGLIGLIKSQAAVAEEQQAPSPGTTFSLTNPVFSLLPMH